MKRYDVDGVHLDDYFYPYKEKDGRGNVIEFPDDNSWKAYRKRGGRLDRNDWRRKNELTAASLADPDGLLEGTGKRHRHVKLRTVADVRAPALRDLLVRAAAR